MKNLIFAISKYFLIAIYKFLNFIIIHQCIIKPKCLIVPTEN